MSSRAIRLFALGCLASLLTPAGELRARVNNTPHDLVSQGYDVPKERKSQNICRPCHLPIAGKDQNFLARIPPSIGQYDKAALGCFSCHDGITFATPEVDATGTAFHPRSHGMTPGIDFRGVPAGAETLFPDLGGETMSCVVCHTPHRSDVRPFLRMGLDGLCRPCHGDKSPDADAAPGTNHPLLSDPLEGSRPGIPLQVDPLMRVMFPEPYPARDGKVSRGTHWDLGGHLSEGEAGILLCFTCHAVHGDEASPPTAGLLSLDPVREEADLLCEGCHKGKRGDGRASPPHPNPGGTVTSRTYHPADDDEGNGPGKILVTVSPPEWPLGSAAPRRLICTTCHTAHGAWEGTPILRPPVISTSFCEECHTTMPLEYHHPTGTASGGDCSPSLPDPLYGNTRTGVQCADCHKAHNAGLGSEGEEDYVPILREPLTSMASCLICHDDEDPTCGGKEGGMASHFMGDPTADDTYADPDPPLRLEPWPESGLTGMYEGENAKGVGCLSCHAFRPGAVTSGDDGESRHLLARSGNMIEWEEGKENLYLCTGCHTANPGTMGKGHTHPLMSADVLALAEEPKPPVTVTPGGKINCDSCHVTHGAPSAGGYYILEVVRSANTDPKAVQPTIDFSMVCHSCHEASKY
jgi:predicted CXXCH cytochrome family protein